MGDLVDAEWVFELEGLGLLVVTESVVDLRLHGEKEDDATNQAGTAR